MTTDDRLAKLERELDGAFARLSAAYAAILALSYALTRETPGLSDRVARLLLDEMSDMARAAGTRGSERNAAAIEDLANRLLALAPPRRAGRGETYAAPSAAAADRAGANGP